MVYFNFVVTKNIQKIVGAKNEHFNFIGMKKYLLIIFIG